MQEWKKRKKIRNSKFEINSTSQPIHEKDRYSSLVINDQLPMTNDLQYPALCIYDVSGRLVKNLSVGTGHAAFGTDLETGIYFMKVEGYEPVKVVKVR